jgi:hypothetical protein
MNIQNILNSWGKAQRQMPENFSSQKAKILAGFELIPKIKSPRFSFKLPIYALSSVGLVLLVVIIYGLNTKGSTTLTDSTLSRPLVFQDNLAASKATSNSYQEMDKKIQGLQALDSNSGMAPVMPVMLEQQTANNSAPSSAYSIQNELIYENSELLAKPAGTIKDVREFLKINYTVNLNVRNVFETVDVVQNFVNSLSGRVDASQINKNRAYISFVIPKSNLEAFKISLKNQVGDRFYFEATDSSSLLPEKQVIEKNTQVTQNTVMELNRQQADLDSAHQQTVSGLNSRIYTLNKQLKQVQDELKINSMNLDLLNREQGLKNQISKLSYSLDEENYSYQNRTAQLNYELSYQQDQLKNLNEQDQNLIDTADTVSGTIYVIKISFLDYINAYVPFVLSLPVLFIALASAFIFTRRQKIEIP